MRAFIGDHDLNRQDGSERMVTATQQNIVIHPNHQNVGDYTHFDVAIVKFDEKLIDGKLADRACLPAQLDFNLSGAKCWTAGWGNRPGWGFKLNEVKYTRKIKI